LLRQVIAAARDLTGSEAAFVLKLDEGSRTLSLLAAPPGHKPTPSGAPIMLDQSAAGHAITERRPILLSQTEADVDPLGEEDLALSANTRSVLAVPLMVRGNALGALLAINKSGPHYTGEDSAILEILAAPTAMALENTALQRRLELSSTAFADLDRLKTDFIAITSHELRTPLGLILGHATFLRELLDPPYREQLEVIIKNASRLKEIVESLANMDNFKTGGARLHLQQFALQDLVDEVLDSYADTAAKRSVDLRAESGSRGLIVEADRTKITIALGNLIRNALAFTDAGGHVLVKCESLQQFAKVSVIDDGVGIPASDLPRVFDRFFQVESHLTRHHSGMGLGLSVAKAMIEMHGGRIWVESTEGKGSDFSFLLPCKPLEFGATGDLPA
jgi:signal transduction histidine kinase